VARGTWASLIFETKGAEEELSFLCRVQAGAATKRAADGARAATGASNKQGEKHPADKRKKERARRRRQAWEEKGGALQWQEQQQQEWTASQEQQSPVRVEQQPWQEQQLWTGAADIRRSNSRWSNSRGSSSTHQQE
jgi:hypothetical protein